MCYKKNTESILLLHTYDNANRLTSLQNSPSSTVPIISSYTYTLDGNGNRTNIIQNEQLIPIIPTDSTDLTYNSAKNRLLSAGSVNFTYDDEGQLANKDTTTYSFDYEHRLKTVIANTMTLSS